MNQLTERSGSLETIPNMEFVENPETRAPLVLILDVSGSMKGEKIAHLQSGLRTLKSELINDPIALRRVDVAVVTFGGLPHLVHDFSNIDDFDVPALRAEHSTPMGAAISYAFDLMDERQRAYQRAGVPHLKPIYLMVTDGEPTDSVNEAARRIQDLEEDRKGSFFAVGVDQADMVLLDELSVRKALMLRNLDFNGLFKWLSKSMTAMSKSTDGIVQLDDPTSPQGWATF